MYLKKYLLYTFLGVFPFLLAQCSDEKYIDPLQREMVTLHVPLSTKAGDPAYESKIQNARMIVAHSASRKILINTVVPNQIDPVSQEWAKFIASVPVGDIDLYLFANELSSWNLNSYTVGSNAPTANQLQAMTLDVTDYPDVDITHPIPMFLYHQNIHIDKFGVMTMGGAPLTTFEVVRIFSKVRIKINCPYSALPDATPMTLDSVYIRQMPKKSWLLAKTHDLPGGSANFFDGTYYDPSYAKVANATALDGTAGFYHEYIFYIPEYIPSNASLYTYLVLTAHRNSNPAHRFHYKLVIGNGIATKTIQQMFASTTPSDFRIPRNTYYILDIEKITAFGEDDVIAIVLNPTVSSWTVVDIPLIQ